MNKEGCCVENAWFLNNSHKSSNGSGDEVTSEIIIISIKLMLSTNLQARICAFFALIWFVIAH